MSNSNDTPWKTQRVFVALAALPLAAFPALILRKQLQNGFEDFWLGILVGTPCLTAAILCGWFALRGEFSESRARMRYPVLVGLAIGGISFAAGFFGPMILTPNSNQGPMLGIFVTGPIGFLAGIVIGAIVGFVRNDGPPTDAGRLP